MNKNKKEDFNMSNLEKKLDNLSLEEKIMCAFMLYIGMKFVNVVCNKEDK